jgi:hypothetical protein
MINSAHGKFTCMGALVGGSHFLLWVAVFVDKKKNKNLLGIQ